MIERTPYHTLQTLAFVIYKLNEESRSSSLLTWISITLPPLTMLFMIGYLGNAVDKDVIKKGKYMSFMVCGIQMLVDNIFDQTFASISSM